MSADPVILRSDDARLAGLLADGWVVSARSWGAQLDARRVDEADLRARVAGIAPGLRIRELGSDDRERILELDAATIDDYPGGPATRHAPFTPGTALMGTPARRAFGALDADGRLVALTILDVDVPGARAETDVTVVAPAHRSRGLGRAVKAASVLALRGTGIRTFRTGGSRDNAAIMAAGTALGYRIDEEWLTLDAPEPADDRAGGRRTSADHR
ncbi:acetyltransferase [Clavibacter capsici]|uniref:acetyltransferase n=1 Tax=Clavibacter capsici TaxID=1874630 RepID=UPI0014281DEC|nr:acetyltransferase [Clavibacter capsici]QIS42702.1 acetyltransferase [Clavibacter capsici]